MKRRAILLAFALFSALSYAQISIYGTITNANTGEALVGATISGADKSVGAVSNEEGKYELDLVSSENQPLQIKYVGYETKSLIASESGEFNIALVPGSYLEEIIVLSTRANENTPTTFSNVDKQEINKKNLGQDMPFLLNMEPSVVTTSDAGAGIGYTGLWIRGSNIQRINVTVNGIPLNDPESHGVFWVNMPDFASSVENVQIQRGVGTSTNGGGAFGANINLQTGLLEKKAYGEINSSYGSFNTLKNNVKFGTGLINNKWAFDGRVSKITSDGYLDNSSSDLKSLFLQGGYYGNNTTLKLIYFTGQEVTQQAWNGVDKETMENAPKTNPAAFIYDSDWNVVGTYDNAVDNYQQDHYQLHLAQKINNKLSLNGALHYTYGRGYYEQYNGQDFLENYPIGNQIIGGDTITQGDVIVRRWLDNHFYGGTFSLNYSDQIFKVILGGGVHNYSPARHFGEIIWAQYAGETKIRDKYYDNTSDKLDANTYLKSDIAVNNNLSAFIDLQIRNVKYNGQGTDKGGANIDIDENYFFFNPKFGLTYDIESVGKLYASYAISNREPIRTDFTDAPDDKKPEPEQLGNIEVGVRKIGKSFSYSANFYNMHYSNQLVLTGEINDVGSPIRENVGKSSRTGVELDAAYMPIEIIKLRANFAYGIAKGDYKEVDSEGNVTDYSGSRLAYSPDIVSNLELGFLPIKNFEFDLIGKYVSRTYLDNTENKDLSLDAYFIPNLRLAYLLPVKSVEEIRLSLMVNNLINQTYASNGYVYYGTPYFYPQAGINFLAGANIRF